MSRSFMDKLSKAAKQSKDKITAAASPRSRTSTNSSRASEEDKSPRDTGGHSGSSLERSHDLHDLDEVLDEQLMEVEIICRGVAIAPFPTEGIEPIPGIEYLVFAVGDRIDVVGQAESGWWEGVIAGDDKLGIFPGTHIKVMDDDAAKNANSSSSSDAGASSPAAAAAAEGKSAEPAQRAPRVVKGMPPAKKDYMNLLNDPVPTERQQLVELVSQLKKAVLKTDDIIAEKTAELGVAGEST